MAPFITTDSENRLLKQKRGESFNGCLQEASKILKELSSFILSTPRYIYNVPIHQLSHSLHKSGIEGFNHKALQ